VARFAAIVFGAIDLAAGLVEIAFEIAAFHPVQPIARLDSESDGRFNAPRSGANETEPQLLI
jgi:hypothetical protein